MNDQLIEKAKKYIRELFKGNSGGHDAGHSLRVYSLAMRIADTQPECDRTVVALAALLHDADDYKLFNTTIMPTVTSKVTELFNYNG